MLKKEKTLNGLRQKMHIKDCNMQKNWKKFEDSVKKYWKGKIDKEKFEKFIQ